MRTCNLCQVTQPSAVVVVVTIHTNGGERAFPICPSCAEAIRKAHEENKADWKELAEREKEQR